MKPSNPDGVPTWMCEGDDVDGEAVEALAQRAAQANRR